MMKADVQGLMIKLEIDGKTSLWILLDAVGSINRQGDGSLENNERALFIGRTNPAIFEAVRSQMSETMLQSLGSTFEHKQQQGARCNLTLTVQFKNGTTNALTFLYGFHSEGPPGDLADFVRFTVQQTDPWHQDSKSRVAKPKNL